MSLNSNAKVTICDDFSGKKQNRSEERFERTIFWGPVSLQTVLPQHFDSFLFFYYDIVQVKIEGIAYGCDVV
jgi:hypothetical protein